MSVHRFSILINNFNYARFLPRAIDSALAQRGAAFEVVVVDDGSNDDSRRVIEGYGGAIRPIFQDNRGQAAALNAAVAASTGDILCFLDADDWWHPDKLAATGAAFDADPGVVMAYHRLQPTYSNGRLVMKPIPRTLCRGDLVPRMTRSAGWWPFPMTSAVSVTRSAWDQAGEIPERLRISADAWLVGIYPFLGCVAACPKALGSYRIHDNAWFRATPDAEILLRRMAHWRSVVSLSNAFLEGRGSTLRLDLEDHLELDLARAEIEGVDLRRRLSLSGRSLVFAGEPSWPRRLRNAVRTARNLPSRRSAALTQEETK